MKPRELWLSRELLLFLAQRDVKARYKQAFFGIGCSIVQPLAGVAVLVVLLQPRHEEFVYEEDALRFRVAGPTQGRTNRVTQLGLTWDVQRLDP